MLNNLPLEVFKSLVFVLKFSSEAMITMDNFDFLKFVFILRLFAVPLKLWMLYILSFEKQSLGRCWQEQGGLLNTR